MFSAQSENLLLVGGFYVSTRNSASMLDQAMCTRHSVQISRVHSMVENGDEDWCFGHGRAQFLTGEL
jgi:hypothetical protein